VPPSVSFPTEPSRGDEPLPELPQAAKAAAVATTKTKERLDNFTEPSVARERRSPSRETRMSGENGRCFGADVFLNLVARPVHGVSDGHLELRALFAIVDT